MSQDTVVEEVRRIREEQASKHGFDIKAILAAARRRQRKSGHRVVSFVPTDKRRGTRASPTKARSARELLS